jgi:DNA-binding MarR family transcriptional regulator
MFERCLYFNVNALARQVNRVWEEAFGKLDLSPSHAYLLRVVLAEPGIGQKDLGKALKLEKSTVTRFVNALEAKGLVKRSKVESRDGREQRIYPTDKAMRIRDELEQTGEALYRKMFSGLGGKELKALVAQLREAASKLD